MTQWKEEEYGWQRWRQAEYERWHLGGNDQANLKEVWAEGRRYDGRQMKYHSNERRRLINHR